MLFQNITEQAAGITARQHSLAPAGMASSTMIR